MNEPLHKLERDTYLCHKSMMLWLFVTGVFYGGLFATLVAEEAFHVGTRSVTHMSVIGTLLLVVIYFSYKFMEAKDNYEQSRGKLNDLVGLIHEVGVS